MSKKILIVDDDLFMLQLMRQALTREGFQCLIACSVNEAFELLWRETPDMILSDYQMPGVNGFEFREQVMKDKRWKNIPFVFLTSFTDEELMLQGLDMQVVDYIVKDTPLPIIISKLNNVLLNTRKQHEKSIQELKSAAEALNLKSVPSAPPEIAGFYINFFHQTFQNYPGGDFIDFISVDDAYTFVVLGDVMGKKWGAWVFSFNFLSYVRSVVRVCVFDGDLSTASILKKINNVIYLDPVLSEVLSTLSLLMIDHKTGSVQYSGAGDLPLIYYKRASGEIGPVHSEGLLLGVRQDGQYDEKCILPEAGDRFLMISDGIIDYMDETGKKSNFDVFVQRLQSLEATGDLFKAIESMLKSQESQNGQVDDRSLIFIEKT